MPLCCLKGGRAERAGTGRFCGRRRNNIAYVYIYVRILQDGTRTAAAIVAPLQHRRKLRFRNSPESRSKLLDRGWCGRVWGPRPARPGRARLGMTLEPLLGSTALHRADVSWNTSSEPNEGGAGGRGAAAIAVAERGRFQAPALSRRRCRRGPAATECHPVFGVKTTSALIFCNSTRQILFFLFFFLLYSRHRSWNVLDP